MKLLDTNTCIEFLRQRSSSVAARMSSTPERDIRLCSIVEAELSYGASRSQHPQQSLQDVARFVSRFLSLPFDSSAALVFGRIRAELDAKGRPIGPYDLQIASIALVHGLTLVTHNTREFARVSGLVLEDWQTSP